MNFSFLAVQLRAFADNLDAGNTNASEEELLEICDKLGFVINPESKISKYQAIKFLDVSRATFDNYIAKGLIPKGMEQQGFKEKFWYKKDLVKFKEKYESEHKHLEKDESGSKRKTKTTKN